MGKADTVVCKMEKKGKKAKIMLCKNIKNAAAISLLFLWHAVLLTNNLYTNLVFFFVVANWNSTICAKIFKNRFE